MAERRLPILASPDDVARVLQDDAVLVVDLCNPEVYETGHVPGAVNLSYRELVRRAPPVLGLLPREDDLRETLSGIGLTPEQHVVAYDDEGNGRASRLLWTLEALGHFNFSLLDGGLHAWRAAGQPLETAAPAVVPSDYPARITNPDVLVERDEVLASLDDPGTVIVDARSPAEYAGEDVRAARPGHIPGAVNLEWKQLMDPGNHLRLQPVETLRTLFKQAGVTPDKAVITHCQTHHRSALTFFALRYLGYPSVRGYAGSWSEWGNDADTPIEAGDAGVGGDQA